MVASEVQVNLEVARKLGLLEEEYEKIKSILGRNPNFNELSIYSVMWSEHCSYKNSITYLKKLPRKGKRLLVEAGDENAGLVDIGDGLACAFKIESHNHPSCIEPFQGAATGVGGIHRDIFTMGARPIAALNSLRFGNIDMPHTRKLIRGVVSGIGSYGNSFGVPTVGGEVYFNDCYNQNILVNAMSVGIVKVGETVSAIADGPGNTVLIVGSATGKDGIHGASFASKDLTEDSANDIPAVQVGDPFQEKKLLEATLEAIKTGAIVGMQDMGAAGITCSTSEMSAKSGTGMRIDLSKVPTRQEGMFPFEILLSESQERMLIVAKQGQEHLLLEVFDKWDLECAIIGEVTDTGRIEYYHEGELVADVPADTLVLGGGAPIYQREFTRPKYLDKVAAFDISTIPIPQDFKVTARNLWNSPNIVSKNWISQQYDSMVRTNTATTNSPSDAAIIRIKETKKALTVSTDCNSAYVYADPYAGAVIAVSEACRNHVCAGATPVAITNCLNFGNPYDPEVFYQFVKALEGMGDACTAYDTPVTGGNVSFYNQTVIQDKAEPVYPTPTIGMLGIIDNIDLMMTSDFKSAGDMIYLIGESKNDISSSEYLRKIYDVTYSPAPYVNIGEEIILQKSILKLIKLQLIESAHDVSEGGLFVTLMESGMHDTLGFDIDTDKWIRKDAFLFGEAQGRVVVSVKPEKADNLEHFLKDEIKFLKLGIVTSESINIDGEQFGDISNWRMDYDTFIEQKMRN
jgi:phosphoribosylformylglycinamidine synthase subunit PurL